MTSMMLQRQSMENLAPEGQKNAKEPKDKTNNSASDIIANAAALDAAKKARDNAAKKVKEAKLGVWCCNSQSKAI